MSTSVGAFGSGIGGGVELTIKNVAQELINRGLTVHLVAPSGSHSETIPIVNITGTVHPFAQNQSRDQDINFPANSVLANMWQYALQVQHSYDLIVNFAYDWLPFYLTPFFQTPTAHFVSMGSLSRMMDRMILQCLQTFPYSIGMYTQAQIDSFQFDPLLANQIRILSSGIDLSLYEFCEEPEPALGWVARIAPEKGLEDAAQVSAELGIELRIMGKMQDLAYWEQVQKDYPQAKLNYTGFHDTHKLQALLGKCQALLMTPKWVEAFGNVAIEALACGVPVISYARGGPVEIIKHGRTGFLVEPDSIEGLCTAVTNLPRISRLTCRRNAEAEFSLTALGDRFIDWFREILTNRRS
ncbi:MAG: glycosyltransferase [Pseudanabaenaceae cyanobacterium]